MPDKESTTSLTTGDDPELDDDEFLFLHRLFLDGSLDGVDVCPKCVADYQRPIGGRVMPYMLAKPLGCKNRLSPVEKVGRI